MAVTSFDKAIATIKRGGIIAYPTEAVYGFGCDPFNQQAVQRLLAIKHRSQHKGLILIAADWQQINPLITSLPTHIKTKVAATWPGAITWLLPVSTAVPRWICGDHKTVAIRMTAHPLAQQLCRKFGNPIVSTSANIEGEPPALDKTTITVKFADKIDYILEGPLGGLAKPTPIYDALSEKIIRT